MPNKKPKKQITRRQHWLPKTSYLKNFANDAGQVTVYWFNDENRAAFHKTAEIKEVAPINVGVEKDLYETKSLPPNTIENVLANIESAYGRVLENKILKHKPLNANEHEIVAQYVSALENRTPL